MSSKKGAFLYESSMDFKCFTENEVLGLILISLMARTTDPFGLTKGIVSQYSALPNSILTLFSHNGSLGLFSTWSKYTNRSALTSLSKKPSHGKKLGWCIATLIIKINSKFMYFVRIIIFKIFNFI